ncbi:MAG: hypothetical protein LCH62_18105, partial [Proteobacteria bacterium]|nr:hypothetical protein [Pseudomonadota bacterium]
MKKTKFFIFGINLALENIGTTFVLSPVRKNIGKRMIFAEMKTLKNFLFTLGLLIGCSLVAFGQTEDKKEPPKKVNPPTINPVDKDKP